MRPTGILWLGVLLAATAACAADAPRRPNIVFFLCDDLGSGDLSCLGSQDIQTPNIDALFARGTRLSRHWAGNAVCAPSRCVLMTGKHPGHAAVRSNREVKPEGQAPMPAGTVTLVRLLKDAGYATGVFGKWGLGPPGSASDPIACGFDAFFGYNCQREAHSFYPDHLWDGRTRVEIDNRSLEGGPVRRSGTVPTEQAAMPDSFAPFVGRHFSADLIADRQLAFIEDHAAGPFFLYVPTTVPHLALQVPPDEPSLRDYENHFGDEAPYLGDRGYVPCRRPLATYAAMITRMDREVGRIVKQLDDLGLTNDTIFIFTSDNGATWPGVGGIDTARLKSNGSLRDWKASPYEGGLRVPAVAVWPGHIPAGSVIDAPTGFEDWLPTLLDLAGLHDRIPADVDGASLAAALAGKVAAPQDRILYRELTERQWQTALDVGGRWKAVRRAVGKQHPDQPQPTELYDLAADPGETKNVAADHPEIVRRMEAILDREHAPDPAWPLPFADARSAVKPAAAAAPAVPPNFVVIFIDDLGYGDIGPFGATKQKTPHLDLMAAEGMKLTSFYAAPACSVSRAQLLTGCYGIRVGVPGVYMPAGPHGLHPAEVTVAERLKTIGYATACIGKWHLGDQPEFLPTRQGFDRYYGIPYSNDMQRVSAETGQRVVPVLRDEKVDELLTDNMQSGIVEKSTAEAVRFIEESKNGPFFLYMPHTAVHAPIVPGERFRGKSDNGTFGDWVEEVDWSVGRILDTLRRLGLDENTLVIFTSDNGPWVSVVGEATTAGPLRGSKGSTWEGGVRVPTLARWPGHIAPGTTCDTVAGTIDLLPTLVTLAGGTVPPEPVIDGRDISGLLLGTAPESPREAHYYFSGNTLQAVRKGPWKLAIAPQVNGMGKKNAQSPAPASLEAPRLYNLESDIGETTDVAAAHPAVVADLKVLALAMQQELGNPQSPARRPAGTVANPQTIYPTVPEPPKQKPAAKPVAATRTGPPRPNIVLFLADDLGYGELGCYGNTAAITPNLDRFAREGLRLTDCHSASSVCSPSRSSLLTGRTPFRNGVFTWIPEKSPIHLRTSELALPKLLKEAGYATCHVGKWHLNGMFNSPEQPQPSDHGYDWWLATQNNAAPSHAFPENFVRNGAAVGKVDDYSAPFVVKEAVHWLTTNRDPTKPFFLAVWTHEPHYPIASAERYEKQHAAIADPEERTYRANITQLDDAFGTLMKTLDDIGAADSTLVFFTSDNGPEGDGDKGPGRGLAGPLRGRKRSMYEGGHRVPGIVRWPGTIEPGTESGLPVIGSDFFPTALRAAGLEPPPGRTLDGVDISGPAVEQARPLYWRWGGKVAYREGAWKIVVDEALEKPELYNLAEDLAETTDLAAREPGRLAALMARLRAYTAEVEAEGPDWWRKQGWNGPPKKKPLTVPAG